MNAMPSKDNSLSRRSFLGWLIRGSLAGSALLGLGALMRYLSFPSEADPPSQYDLGPASGYPLGSRIVVNHVQAVIIHDEQGYHALSLVCPHLGCSVNPIQDGFTCPCHGSSFSVDGSLRKGPSSNSLKTLIVKVDSESNLVLYTQ